MTIEKDILNLLSIKDIPHYDILDLLYPKHEKHITGKAITKLTEENKISFSSERKFIFKITDLGKFELKNTLVKFYLNHWKWLIPVIIASFAAIFGLLNYLK